MKIQVFARLREILGNGQIDLPMSESMTAGELRAVIAGRWPDAAAILAKSLVAVNNEYVSDDRPIGPTDAVALIPPVSGG
ncbi:MoaD/ThiS family protein [Zavarzinella formosa]|uniref:MoaD/ThiS family protein n=1 Tax=Zavarzinella formosa TaxID=360055 RepID=UPI000319C6E5|nr:MoaD/ThiS family protein [Zavarzinella formosa]